MTDDPVAALAFAAIARFEARQTRYSRFVFDLELAVNLAEEAADPRARDLRRTWGQLEIINAVGDGTVDAAHQFDVEDLVDRIRLLLER